MNAWSDFTTAALLGTGKTSSSPQLPADLDAVCGEARDSNPEIDFSHPAGALALWRQAGLRPKRIRAEVAPAPPETTAPVSRVCAAHLRMMLGGHCSAVLPEWLREVASRGFHLPSELLPALLDRARQDRSLRPLVLASGGQRAQWLGAHNPDWSFTVAVLPELWETGSRDQRRAILHTLRMAAPADARSKIETAWKSEPAEVRAAFVAELETGLSNDDAPFLETILDDRSKEVRRAAVDVLARLPSSLFVTRMMARSASLLTYKRGGLVSRPTLEVTLPADPDLAAVRDGLDGKAFGAQKTLGAKSVFLVLILSAVPLSRWEDSFDATPEVILKAAEKNEFSRALVTGWAWAALRQRNVAWAEAIIDAKMEPHFEFLPGQSLLSILPEASRAERLVASLRGGALKKSDANAWQGLAAQLGAFSGPWPDILGREVLSALRSAAAGGIPWHLRATAESLIVRLPAALLSGAGDGWPIDQEGVAGLVELITFRHEALTALNQS